MILLKCEASSTLLVGHFASLVVSKKSFATPRDGLSGHFASLMVSEKVPGTNWDF